MNLRGGVIKIYENFSGWRGERERKAAAVRASTAALTTSAPGTLDLHQQSPPVDLSRRHFDLDLLGSGFIRTCFWVLKSGLAPPGFWYCMFCDLVAFRIYPGNYNN